jgi:processive 1,2-diacylglycerol beta-glucosyltransferase
MKIFVFYATAGIGHRKAAEAIYEEIKHYISNEHKIRIFDSLDYTNPLFKFIYSSGYTFLISRLPIIWGFFYWLTDTSFTRYFIGLCRSCCNFLNSRKLSKFLSKQQPEIIISTHFFANQIISWLKNTKRLDCKLICVITDYSIHSFWLANSVDIYTVANQNLKDDLISYGIKADKIKVTGIPVKRDFLKIQNKYEICRKINVNPDIFTALIVTGAIGVGPITTIVKTLQDEVQLIVVCGKNRRLFNKLSRSKFGSLRVFGFIDNIHDLMAVSDVVITKGGGLTISESLVQRLPMIFFNLIPGQEEANAKLIEGAKAGIIAKNVKQIRDIVLTLKNNPQILDKLKNNIALIAKPEATNNILKLINEKKNSSGSI